MKTVLLVAFVALIAVSVSAQSEPSKNAENNLYSLALKTSILQMEKDWGHIDDSVGGENIRTDYRHMIVQKDSQITNGLPAEFENHFVEYLDRQALIERYKKWGKSYAALVIEPMQNEGRILKIAANRTVMTPSDTTKLMVCRMISLATKPCMYLPSAARKALRTRARRMRR